ncbi:hypothetical protein SAMN04488515_2251 [Cognatiyoonia koreensis]|uniref:Sulfotransferase family protein n=1 Tax=Cognatiyoonia koreensis TaxID=364200 RepID=A0A1I0QVM5_9RHOB|nr:hypothetical protein [Cognatiyoonia koreensis]SEW31746.1 hypothetical protein SAMN04488515_2251 [Cognatiyoonia koreensis]
MPEPIRVIVHPGFHKTGTSSLQSYLKAHRSRLTDYGAIYLKADFLDAGNLGRIYGLRPFFWRRRQFRRAFDAFLTSIPQSKVIFLSWEGFSGVMPGHRRVIGGTVQDFKTAAIPLGREIIAALRERFGPNVEITFLYTLRDHESWIKSVYGHVVRSIRITDDFETFCATLSDLPDIMTEAQTIGHALGVPVITARLEETGGHRLGPARAALQAMGVPEDVQAKLPAAHRSNTGLSKEDEAEFLKLNRTINDKAELKRMKDRIAARARADAKLRDTGRKA